MNERPWRTTPEELLRKVTEHWPPPSVEAIFERMGADEARGWARTFGADFTAAWNECPRASWLFVFAIGLAARNEDEDVMNAVTSLAGTTPAGFGQELPGWPDGSADQIRARIDGPALLAHAGLR
jgi:hypothetical protein